MPEKSFRVKISNVKGDVALLNPSDLSELGAGEGAEIDLYTSSRGWKVVVKPDCSVDKGVVFVNRSVAAKLDVEDGGEVRAFWTPPVVEEKYEPPP